ncbi:cysteine-rich CWC family protein [Hydrogenophaga sp.]|uniref:cysteine-rich CWC family protein n=1 Tax=Hydrogenophaga sp. TaxID=1904254 RepID=UPI003D0E0C58
MSTPQATVPDPTRCPLCGGDNRCAMEIERATGQTQPPCWCMSETFDPALFERIPDAARGQACICAACVAAAAVPR